MRFRRLVLLLCLFVFVLAIASWITSGWWLRGIGQALVETSAPGKADAILVLAGDSRGQRILAACALLQQDMAPLAFVTGPQEWYGVNEADGAIRYAVSRGCDSSRLQPIYEKAFSTEEEARVVHATLRERNVRDLLIVTSASHTARSARVFRRELGNEIRFRTFAAPQDFFTPETWWHTREGQKTVFFEVSKTIAYWMGL